MAEASAFQAGLRAGLKLGAVTVPGLLLRAYARLGLTEVEVMLLIHLLYFAEREHTLFPTPDQLASRMSTPAARVLDAIERVVRDGFVRIEEDDDMITGVRGERYDLSPLYARLAQVWEELEAEESNLQEPEYIPAHQETAAAMAGSVPRALNRATAAARRKEVFTAFESEFARPLSPMEYETIIGWLEKDHLSEELILAALKEAVFAGKVHFRYIDRILLEWQRNGIATPEEAKAYTERFRGS